MTRHREFVTRRFTIDARHDEGLTAIVEAEGGLFSASFLVNRALEDFLARSNGSLGDLPASGSDQELIGR